MGFQALVNANPHCQTVAMLTGHFSLEEPLPELKDPHVLAVLRPWIDVGNVGTLSLDRIERHLRAKELGRLVKPGRFYDFTRYRPRSYIDQGKRGYSIPSTIFRYAVREEGPDLVFAHLLEPHVYGEDYTDSVVEVLKLLGTKRYSLIGAMYDMVPHTRPLLVSGASDQPEAEEEHRLVGARSSNYEGPTSITYLISQQAEQMGAETRAFIVHLPQYFQVDEDFTGTSRLMEVLCSLYNFPDRLKEGERGRQQYDALQNIVNDASEVSSLLERLEERYDREQREENQSSSPLSPNVEDFLTDLEQGFDSPDRS